jgi:hypothetical protein
MREGHPRRFAVLIHARNLLVRDESGGFSPGGFFTWRCVTTDSADSAIAAAIRAVVESEAYAEEVDHQSALASTFAADDVIELDSLDDREGSGFVFYVNTDAKQGS